MILNAANYKPEKRIIALCVGESGDGKSTAEYSFPGKTFGFDMDLRFGGVASSLNQGIIKGAENLEYESYSPTDGWIDLEKRLEQFNLDRMAMAGAFKYQNIIIDSITSLARMALNFSKRFQAGKMVGVKKAGNFVESQSIRIAGPADFNVEASAVHDFFDEIRKLPCNILASAHIVQKWGKRDGDSEFAPADIIGEKLSIRDNLGANVLTYFDNVWRFSRAVDGTKIKYSVEFASDLAKNSYGIPPGKHDLTNKEFYPFLMETIAKYSKKVEAPKV